MAVLFTHILKDTHHYMKLKLSKSCTVRRNTQYKMWIYTWLFVVCMHAPLEFGGFFICLRSRIQYISNVISAYIMLSSQITHANCSKENGSLFRLIGSSWIHISAIDGFQEYSTICLGILRSNIISVQCAQLGYYCSWIYYQCKYNWIA